MPKPFADITQIYETEIDEEVNERLKQGWKLLLICKKNTGNPYGANEYPSYILGLPK